PNSQELSKYIYDYSCEVFKKCVPSYKDFKNNEIENFDYYIDSQIYEKSSDKITEVKIRQYQHTFAKRVKDRDKKCLICCEQTPELLQACHIKPYNECVNNIEKYNIDNGITLCANHHILFDKHKFTFNLDWTIKISTNLYTEDTYMRIKEFEECYEILKNSKTSNINKFLEYRNKNYPIL
ncbi:MAG: HNH endonuclease, partial [Ureaplasma sp.]|nr:HNH endonuclease [Ureaplasma sp.]